MTAVACSVLIALGSAMAWDGPGTSSTTPLADQARGPVAAPKCPTVAYEVSRQSGPDVYLHWKCEVLPVAATDEPEYSPQVSPDGKELAYVAGRNHGREASVRLVIRDIAGGVSREILASDQLLGSPKWSPDGHQLAFWWDTRHNGHADIWTVSVPADGGQAEPELVVGADAMQAAPTWAPAGDAVAFARSSPRGARIVVVDLESRSETVLQTRGASGAAFSPDGAEIAVLSADPSVAGTPSRPGLTLYSVADGGVVARRLLTAGGVRSLTWQSGGLQLARQTARNAGAVTVIGADLRETLWEINVAGVPSNVHW